MTKTLFAERRSTTAPPPEDIDGTDTARYVQSDVTHPAIWTAPSFATTLGSGTVYTPADSAAFATALTNSVRGDVIKLDPAVTYTGPFTLPTKSGETSGAAWITICPFDAALGHLTEDVRVDDAADGSNDDIAYMPTISTPYGAHGLLIHQQASRWRIVGIQFRTSAGSGESSYGFIDTTGSASSSADYPSRIVIDRCLFRGRSTNDTNHMDHIGIWMLGNRYVVKDCVGDNFKENDGADAGFIQCYAGGSMYSVLNTKLTSSGECMMFGGTDSDFNQGPTDVYVDGCYFTKPDIWNASTGSYGGVAWHIKNLLEFKNCSYAWIRNSFFDKNWENGQSHIGSGIAVTPRNQSGGDTNATVDNVHVDMCEISNVCTGVRMSNTYGTTPNRLLLSDLLIHQIRPWADSLNYASPMGFILEWVVGDHDQTGTIKAKHITGVQGPDGDVNTYGTLYMEQSGGTADIMDSIDIEDCLLEGTIDGVYGLVFSTHGEYGTPAFDFFWNTVAFNYVAAFNNSNIVSESLSGTANFSGLTLGTGSHQVDFENYATGDYRLKTGCEYKAGGTRQASDSKDRGCDVAALQTALADVLTGGHA